MYFNNSVFIVQWRFPSVR